MDADHAGRSIGQPCLCPGEWSGDRRDHPDLGERHFQNAPPYLAASPDHYHRKPRSDPDEDTSGTFKVCIQDGRASVGDVKRELTFTGEEDQKTVDAKTDCTPIHQTRSNIDIRRPGNWRTSSYRLNHLLMTPEEAEKKFNMKLESHVRFTPRDVARPKSREERSERRALKASVIGGLPKGNIVLV